MSSLVSRLTPLSAARIYLYAQNVDMRKSFDGLFGMVREFLGQDPLSGHLFLFLNRRRDRAKILLWDRDGLVVWAKRLERGRFQLPSGRDAASLTIEVDSVTLAMMIGGVDLDTAKRRKRYQVAAG